MDYFQPSKVALNTAVNNIRTLIPELLEYEKHPKKLLPYVKPTYANANEIIKDSIAAEQLIYTLAQ